MASASLPHEDVAGGKHYAGHLLTRHKVIPFEYNHSARRYEQYRAEGNTIASGDSIASHWLYAGSKIKDIVVNVKSAMPAGMAMVAQIKKVSDDSSVGTALNVDLTAAGFYLKGTDMKLMLHEDCYLDLAITGGSMDLACFAAYVELVEFNDDFTCPCVAEPCSTEFPDPICA